MWTKIIMGNHFFIQFISTSSNRIEFNEEKAPIWSSRNKLTKRRSTIESLLIFVHIPMKNVYNDFYATITWELINRRWTNVVPNFTEKFWSVNKIKVSICFFFFFNNLVILLRIIFLIVLLEINIILYIKITNQ